MENYTKKFNAQRAARAELEAQITRMQGLRDTLKHLADACDGDNRPHCPILHDLAGTHK